MHSAAITEEENRKHAREKERKIEHTFSKIKKRLDFAAQKG